MIGRLNVEMMKGFPNEREDSFLKFTKIGIVALSSRQTMKASESSK